jgi:hypothetical protein
MVRKHQSPAFFLLLAVFCVSSWDSWGQECWLNNPFSPFVKVELLAEGERLKLKLRNDFPNLVTVTEVRISVEGEAAPRQLLEKPVELPPADRYYLDLTGDMLGSFVDQKARQEREIRIRLRLKPAPPDQPDECKFQIAFEKQRFEVVHHESR